MKAPVLSIICVILYTSSVVAGDTDLEARLLQAKAQIALQCSHYQRLSASNRPMEVQQARQGMFMACECMPSELARLSPSDESSGSVEEDLLAITNAARESCAAQGFRKTIASSCAASVRNDDRIGNKAGYCKCMETGADRLTDRQIVEASRRAHREFEARVQARVDGEPAPAPEPSLIDALSAQCLRSDGAAQ